MIDDENTPELVQKLLNDHFNTDITDQDIVYRINLDLFELPHLENATFTSSLRGVMSKTKCANQARVKGA